MSFYALAPIDEEKIEKNREASRNARAKARARRKELLQQKDCKEELVEVVNLHDKLSSPTHDDQN